MAVREIKPTSSTFPATTTMASLLSSGPRCPPAAPLRPADPALSAEDGRRRREATTRKVAEATTQKVAEATTRKVAGATTASFATRGTAAPRSLWLAEPAEPAERAAAAAELRPACTEQADALSVAEQRVRFLLERARRAAAAAAAGDTGAAAAAARCQQAITLFEGVKAAIAALSSGSGGGGGGGGARNKTGQRSARPSSAAAASAAHGPSASDMQAASSNGEQLVACLEALGLAELHDGGPVSLPHPAAMPARTIYYAQMNWEADETDGADAVVAWTDDATLSWVRFALLHARADRGLAHAALCLMARVATGDDVEFEGGKRAADVLEAIKEPARRCLAQVESGELRDDGDDDDDEPAAGGGPVAALVEIWSYIASTSTLDELSASFQAYRDGPQVASLGGAVPDPNDEEGMFMEPYAGCDVCGANLFLPAEQTCPGMGEGCGGLQAFVVAPSQATEEDSFACDVCGAECPAGSSMKGCRDCDFDLCPTCCGPWYHALGGQRDLCGACFAGRGPEDQASFVLVTQQEDLGEDADDYFGDVAGDEEEEEEEEGAGGAGAAGAAGAAGTGGAAGEAQAAPYR